MKKITLVFFGLIFSLVLLEAGLRLGGWALLSLQEYRNRAAIQEKGTYRIMCLGESTTFNQWPPILREILNRNDLGIRFSVIDKGCPGIDTVNILKYVENHLDEYNPDMVVAMMGINDTESELVIMPYGASASGGGESFFRKLKIYKLARFLGSYILNKAIEIGISEAEGKEVLSNYEEYIDLAKAYIEQARYKEAEEVLREALIKYPQGCEAHAELGEVLKKQGRHQEMKELYKNALKISPDCYEIYIGLGDVHAQEKDLGAQEEAYKKAIEIDPYCLVAYVRLGDFYRSLGKYDDEEKMLRKMIDLRPRYYRRYLALARHYRENHKYLQAEQIYKKVIEIYPLYEGSYRALAFCYQEQGNEALAEEYFMRAEKAALENYNPVTKNNYLTLKKILDERGIKLVCVQYPCRSLEGLKKMLGTEKGIIFVDNGKVFRQGVKAEGYSSYFTDAFGGDFGHCTEKGNRLLAENIAKAVLEECFNN